VVTSALQFPKGEFTGLPTEEVDEGFTIHRMRVLVRMPNWRFFYLNNGGFLIRGIGATLRRINPEVLHAHQIAASAWAFAAAWYARTRGRKFFYSPHYHPDADLDRQFRHLILHGLNRLPLSIARRVFHLTANDYEPFAREYPYVPRSRFAVLPNGVAPAPLAPIPAEPGTLRLLFVGRVDDRRKGFDLLRRAFAETRRPGWVLTVIGRVSDATRASLVAEFGPAVRVLGPVDEAALERAYAASDLFVMPSRYEGFGMPSIEAMRYGVAVIGTAVCGVPEVVPQGTGVLVAADDAASLAAALARLGNDPDERARLGAAGRAWASRFEWERVVGMLEAEYAAG
jgi:glycosyltransferase involved in cell wall biosynthesis